MSSKGKGNPATLLPSQSKHDQVAPGIYISKSVSGQTSLAVQTGELPIPERSLFANWVAAHREGNDVEITFGQLPAGCEYLSAALIISIAAPNVAGAIHGENERFRVDLEARVQSSTSTRSARRTAHLPEKGERVAFSRAAIMSLAYGLYEAEVRFYAMHARSLHDLTHGNRSAAKKLFEPVVRVDLTLADLSFLCNELARIVDSSESPRTQEEVS